MTVPNIPAFSNPFDESEETVRTRVAGYVTDPTVDTREGDYFQSNTEPCVKEIATGYEAANFMLKMSNPLYAEGIYLDLVAAQENVERLPATRATGVITVTGEDGTFIPSGSRFSSPATSAQQESVRFLTDEDVTIGISETVEIAVTAEDAGERGNVTASAITYNEDSIPNVATVDNALPFAGGSDIEDDEALRGRVLDEIQQPQAAGAATDLRRWARSRPGVVEATVVPVWEGPWTARIILLGPNSQPVSQEVIEDVQRYLTGAAVLPDPEDACNTYLGVAGNVTGAAVRYRVTYLDDSGAETAPSPASIAVNATADKVELTDVPVGPTGTVKRRIYRAMTVADHTTNNYRLVATINDNVTTTYQDNTTSVATNRLVPRTNNTSEFDGKAPMGMQVSVDTPIVVPIDVSVEIIPTTGYSLDGTGGTVALEAALAEALAAYITSLPPGGDVIYAHVASTFFDVAGVYDIDNLTVEGGTTNVSLEDGQVAGVGVVTFA